jgi:hypothetical protein
MAWVGLRLSASCVCRNRLRKALQMWDGCTFFF